MHVRILHAVAAAIITLSAPCQGALTGMWLFDASSSDVLIIRSERQPGTDSMAHPEYYLVFPDHVFL